MPKHIRKHHVEQSKDFVLMHHASVTYRIPVKIAEKYRTSGTSVKADDIFAGINKKYSKPGALLRGIRIREGLTQIQMAEKIKVTQSDISQIENGKRKIGSKIAKRIAKLFDINYRLFLA